MSASDRCFGYGASPKQVSYLASLMEKNGESVENIGRSFVNQRLSKKEASSMIDMYIRLTSSTKTA
jgi:hypothetical protein